MVTENPFERFLEEQPRQLFFGARSRFGRSPFQQQFFGNRFQSIFDIFGGEQAQQIQRGELPTLRFQNFLEDFNFDEFFRTTPPSLRGGQSTGRFAPSTRFLF